ncbi:helix-turn-helix domain-containing protein [Pseudonocardia sp. WMMC193]|uniref:helix-turn-helix domain-containing protein n=1 Tax=Pseudonocardia sp. WMMC193 TaxID=2911965 RepID=UPI0035ABC981
MLGSGRVTTLSTTELSELSGIPESSLRERAREGEIVAAKDEEGHWRFRPQDVAALIRRASP